MRSVPLWVFSFCMIVQMSYCQTGSWKLLPVPVPGPVKFEFIDFADSANGWVGAPDGSYSTTTDGGKSWGSIRHVPDSNKVVKGKLYDSQTALVAVEVRERLPKLFKLLRTTDGGQSWTSRLLPDSVLSRTAVSILDRTVIGFVNRTNILYTSSDSGATWDTVALPSSFPWLGTEVGILRNGKIMVGGGGGMQDQGFLATSADSGKTWRPFGAQNQLVTVWGQFLNAEMCSFWMGYEFIGPVMNTIFYNAVLDSSVQYDNMMAIGALYKDRSMFAFSAGSIMAKSSPSSTDSTYHIEGYAGHGPRVVQISTVARKYTWALDENGAIYQRIDLLASVQEPQTIPLDAFLFQNYPNPFNPLTTLRYGISERSKVTLKIFDILGRLITTIVDETKDMGKYEVSWDASSAASGMYFVRMTVTDELGRISFSKTNKVLLMK